MARDAILRLEAAMHAGIADGTMIPVQCELRHSFAPGIYMREITMPAGFTITGQIHRCAHLNVIALGDVTVVTQDGVVRITVRPGDPPFIMMSPAGMKRALYTHADTIWSTIHVNPTNETDIAKLDELMTVPTFEALALLEHQPWPG